jgi:hypothetical protein
MDLTTCLLIFMLIYSLNLKLGYPRHNLLNNSTAIFTPFNRFGGTGRIGATTMMQIDLGGLPSLILGISIA